MRVWDAHTGQLRHSLTGHVGKVYGAVLSPDGRLVVSGGTAKKAKRPAASLPQLGKSSAGGSGARGGKAGLLREPFGAEAGAPRQRAAVGDAAANAR